MTDLPAATISLETALLRLHPVTSPFQRIRDALDAARSRNETRTATATSATTTIARTTSVPCNQPSPRRADADPASLPSATYPSL